MLNLQYVRNLPQYLQRVKFLLKTNGVYFANFIGDNSLIQMKKYFIKKELLHKSTHYLRTIPFIRFHDLPNIFKSLGFAEYVFDIQNINIEADNFYNLLKKLKLYKDKNFNLSNYYTINKKLYLEIIKDQNPFKDQLDLISIAASKSHRSLKVNI
jgi:hypothetical protein